MSEPTTVTTSPAPPRRMTDGSLRESWFVAVDAVVVGDIELNPRTLDWHWRLSGMTDSVPVRFGLRTNAIDELVRAASLPSGFRHLDRWHRVPEKLVIVPREGDEE